MAKYDAKVFVYNAPKDIRFGVVNIGCGPTDLVVKVLTGRRFIIQEIKKSREW